VLLVHPGGLVATGGDDALAGARERLDEALDERRRRPKDVHDDDVFESLDDLAGRFGQWRRDRDVLGVHHSIDDLEAAESTEFDQAVPERHLVGVARPDLRESVLRQRVCDDVGVTTVLDGHIGTAFAGGLKPRRRSQPMV